MKQKSAVQTYGGNSPPSNRKERPLTGREKQMVEEHLPLVPKIIFSTVRLNEAVQGLGYDDLYQDGCVALCRAAQTYTGQAAFSTYAGIVVRNYLISKCRSAVTRNSHESPPSDLEEWQETLDSSAGHPEYPESFKRAIQMLLHAKKGCSAAECQGIDALCWRIAGYSCADIGRRFGLNEKLVSKRISLAKRKLQNDPDFLRALR